ncbi:MAG: helix-turn-helix transcriptional regulator [Propionibacteriaceae bacterium]|jgi:transcriptional regulator with XRE-family HTH domain|nr:helix-turn-helix transcriptional regulator [Propionibacteriaceae bacterium]
MGQNVEAAKFLRAKRERITPTHVGFYAAPRRRVKGLRRSEVAQLAGLSVEYYTKIEQGNLEGVSEQVLIAIGRALELDDAELSYLYNLRQLDSHFATRIHPQIPPVPQSYLQVLDSVFPLPAYLSDSRLNVLALNSVGRELFWPLKAHELPVNLFRFTFLDERAKEMYPKWERHFNDKVGILRRIMGELPADKELTALVSELSQASTEFRQLWDESSVRPYSRRQTTYWHPQVGELDLLFNMFKSKPPESIALCLFTPEPGSPSETALRQLAQLATSNN